MHAVVVTVPKGEQDRNAMYMRVVPADGFSQLLWDVGRGALPTGRLVAAPNKTHEQLPSLVVC